MDRFFSFLSRNKSVFSFKNRFRTGKTDDFSSPDIYIFTSYIHLRPDSRNWQSDVGNEGLWGHHHIFCYFVKGNNSWHLQFSSPDDKSIPNGFKLKRRNAIGRRGKEINGRVVFPETLDKLYAVIRAPD